MSLFLNLQGGNIIPVSVLEMENEMFETGGYKIIQVWLCPLWWPFLKTPESKNHQQQRDSLMDSGTHPSL